MRRTSAAILIALTFGAGVAGCGRNENDGGSPDGQGESTEERKEPGSKTTEE